MHWLFFCHHDMQTQKVQIYIQLMLADEQQCFVHWILGILRDLILKLYLNWSCEHIVKFWVLCHCKMISFTCLAGIWLTSCWANCIENPFHCLGNCLELVILMLEQSFKCSFFVTGFLWRVQIIQCKYECVRWENKASTPGLGKFSLTQHS